SIIPIVFVEGSDPTPGPGYWEGWLDFTRSQLADRGWISPEDFDLFYIAENPADAADHICRFYRNYHSSRYVRDELIIRIKHRVRQEDVDRLNDEFSGLVASGRITQGEAHPVEDDHLDLPRIR